MDIAYYYRQAIFAVDPGACNLSGLARSLPEMLRHIEKEMGKEDNVVRAVVDEINRAVDIAWEEKRSSLHVNTHPIVREYVVALNGMAFLTEDTVASHPIIRLMIDQMRQLSRAPQTDEPHYFTRWSDAYIKCKERGQN